MNIMNEESLSQLQKEVAALEKLLAEKKRLLLETERSEAPQPAAASGRPGVEDLQQVPPAGINYHSPAVEKIALFRSLFKGREDVYAKRWENKKKGTSGYQPVCQNEWAAGLCEKPKVKCGDCKNRKFEPVTDTIIRYHLEGRRPVKNSWGQPVPFVMGLYPLLEDETCHFLAIDLDKKTWQEDAKTFMDTCKAEGIPSALERSRSGNGAHIWIFFDKPVQAVKARKLGSFLLTRTLDLRPETGFDSFDRFFPNQDTLPLNGFGNLIALPLQKVAREKGNSVFLDENFTPYPDQWAFLGSIKKMSAEKLESLIQKAVSENVLLPVPLDSVSGEDEDKPWQKRNDELPEIKEPLPQTVEVVLADQLYINHTELPPVLRNRILRLASFANPEFYAAQKMRYSTKGIPHILCYYDFLPKYIGLPAGCLDSLLEILDHYHIIPDLTNKQNRGQKSEFRFLGELRDNQKEAAEKLLAHPTGVLSASTAFGKTVVALWLAAERKVNTLVLVHRTQLADQWAERISQFLGISKKEIGRYSGTKKERTGIIDVAVMQSIVKKGNVAEWVNDYGQIIVDECHHIPAVSFERIIRKCPAFYRLGLSATVVRKDGQHPIVLMNLGDVRYSDNRKNTAPLFAQKVFPRFTGFQIAPTTNPTDTSGTESPSGQGAAKTREASRHDIQDIYRELWPNENRNRLIIEDILKAHHEGRECLVLSDRLEHLDILKAGLQDQVPNLFLLKGGMGKKQLKAIMENMQNIGEGGRRVILSTGKYLGEGFDLPSLDTLFLVFPISWKGTLIQYTGRLNRVYYGKKEIQVYDYVDDKVPVLAGMYRKRVKSYRGMGFVVGETEVYKLTGGSSR